MYFSRHLHKAWSIDVMIPICGTLCKIKDKIELYEDIHPDSSEGKCIK